MSSTQETAPLDNTSEAAGVAQQRINDLMSKWQSEQAVSQRLQTEVTRLQGLLATAVGTEADLRQQISQATQGTDSKISEADQRATTAESVVADLRSEVGTLRATNARLSYVVANQDLVAYAAVLPTTEDTATLDAAAATIRNANQSFRQNLNPSRSGGQTPRTGIVAPMNADDIGAYLRNGPADQFEQRLAEATARIRR